MFLFVSIAIFELLKWRKLGPLLNLMEQAMKETQSQLCQLFGLMENLLFGQTFLPIN